MRYEYRVVPAPTKGQKAKGLKTGEARFANAVEALMNQMASEGWEYQRAETLPSTERAGLTSTTTLWRNLLVFRRAIEAAVDEIIAANPDQVAKARENPKLAGWFVGQVMKATGGKANPAVVNQLVMAKLGL